MSSGPYGGGTFGGDVFGGTTPTRGTITTVSAVGITVVANTITMPPRFEISIATPDGSVMTAVTLSRTIRGVTELTRVQPTAGLSFRYVEDYEAEWGVDVVYTATVTTAAGTVKYVAPPIPLNPWGAWAIHPLTPVLSFCIDQQDNDAPGVVDIQTVSRPTQSTQHTILGSARPVTVRVGPRASTRTVLRVQTVDLEDEANLWSLVDDQTPLVIQFPTDWAVGWEYGYYDVGDVSAERVLQWSGDPRRIFTLPTTRVDRPAGTQQSDWGYAQLLHDFADYPAVLAAFDDYPSLLANRRT
jgi:hypothetical protein